jgi:hypothetical protein
VETALLIPRLLLALVFPVAGQPSSPTAPGLAGPNRLRGAGRPGGPVRYCATASRASRRDFVDPSSHILVGRFGALSLLLLFVVGIGANLARGRKPDRHSFGQLHSAPVGWSTLARNGALAALASLVL